MPYPNGMPKGREIPHEDWEHFLTLIAIKTHLEKTYKRRIPISEASVIFAMTKEAQQNGMGSIIIFKDEKLAP